MNKNAQGLGRLGGIARSKNHTSEEIAKMSRIGGYKTLELKGREYYKEINQKSQIAKRLKKLISKAT